MLTIQGVIILTLYLAIEQVSNSWTMRLKDERPEAPHLPLIIQLGALLPLVILPVFLIQLYRPLNWIGVSVSLCVLIGLRLWWKLANARSWQLIAGATYTICLFLFLFVPFAKIIKGEYQFGGKKGDQVEDRISTQAGAEKE